MIEPPRPAATRRCATAWATKNAAAHVDRHHRVVVLDPHVEHVGRPIGAGVVDQHVERRRRRDRACHGVEVGDVEHQRLGPAAVGPDSHRRLLDLLGGACDQGNVRAGLGERRRGGQSDAAPSAGYQGAPTVEPERRRAGQAGLGHSAASP